MQPQPPSTETEPSSPADGAPKGVQIYDRPASADRARKLMPIAIGVAVLVSVGVSVLVAQWIW